MIMKELDVTELADSFQKRLTKIISGQHRVNTLKALIHWVKKFHRNYMEPYIDGLYQDIFNSSLATPSIIQEIQKVHIDNSDNVIKESSPGTLESEAKFQDYMPTFTNLLSYVFGADLVPLSYFIR